MDADELTGLRSLPTDEVHEYGNPVHVLYRVAFVGVIITVLVVVATGISMWSEGRLEYLRSGTALGGFLALLTIMPLGVLPTVLFRIRLIRGRVQHVFLNRYVVSDYPIHEYERTKRNSRGCAAVLHFQGGHKIHFFGAQGGELDRMEKDLKRMKREAAQGLTT
jgi:hypothetical protein